MPQDIAIVDVVGAGLAGCEVAWQLAELGISVRLHEMKPRRRTPAQVSDFCAELVCSNSLRSANVHNAVGLLKEEMRRLGSIIIRTALQHRVPAGDALAVDREMFGRAITAVIDQHPRIERICATVEALPETGNMVVATGPLTDAALAADIARLAGTDGLYFYDAIAPIVSAASIDYSVAFAASRYGKGEGADYCNCPLTAEQYAAFYAALVEAECVPFHSFEKPRYFQGCLPVEVVARGGVESLRFGAMKPVGLTDPRTGRRPHAVLQLRREDLAGQAFNLVGFQTKLKYAQQQRVFRLVPGLQNAEFLRYGAMHRNTYLNSPDLLDAAMRLRSHPHIRFAGQITGVEGYVESAAHGLVTALLLARELRGEPLDVPPPECAVGALMAHVSGTHRAKGQQHEPQNINWAMFPPAPVDVRKKDTKAYRLARACASLEQWAQISNVIIATRCGALTGSHHEGFEHPAQTAMEA